MVFATPLIRALKRRFPDARVSWLVEPHTQDLVTHHPELDGVIVWPRQEWKRLFATGRLWELWRRMRAFRRELRRLDFDVAFDLQGLLKSAVIAWASGAPRRIGVGSREASHLFMTEVFQDHDLGRVSSQYRELAEFLGLEPGDFPMEVALSEDDRGYADRRIRERGLEDGFVVLVPFTTWPQKHWVEPRWSELAGVIQDRFGLPSVLLGGPGDREAADRIRAGAPGIVDLVGSTSLTEASALISRCSALVGVDTGLNHIGIAFDRPTVSLFGANVPYYATPTERGTILHRRLPCSPCHRRPTCNGAYPCMSLITVSEVVAALDRTLLRRSDAPGPPSRSPSR